jgi:muramoyltetrapeptide carboxypeptidase LdcA involved in peptidoglycan recycling
MIFGRRERIEFKKLKPMNSVARKKRKWRGKVVGGNLAVLQSGLGTRRQV